MRYRNLVHLLPGVIYYSYPVNALRFIVELEIIAAS